jgi:hypothetical protein
VSQVRTDSGLIVPQSAVTKTERRFPAKAFGLIRRFVQANVEGVTLALVCKLCAAPIAMSFEENATTVFKGGHVVMTCKCSRRTVR